MMKPGKQSRRIARHSLILSLGLFTLSPGPSSAGVTTYSGSCGTELTSVSQAIYESDFSGRNATTDQSNLQTKLDAANSKITLKKYSDAIDKLSNISDTATALATAKKRRLDNATAINNTVSDAISCVNGLIKS